MTNAKTKQKKELTVQPVNQARITKALKKWERVTQSLSVGVKASERLTESDFAIRINAKA
jgi:hypothetical protein